MGIIDHNTITGAGSPKMGIGGSGEQGGAINWIQQATTLINSINQLITSITSNPLVASRLGAAGSNVLLNDPSAKTGKRNPPAPTQQQQSMNDQDLIAFFKTPEGMMKIAQAIDMVIPITGDIKLSQLKNALKDFSPKPKQEKKEAKK